MSTSLEQIEKTANLSKNNQLSLMIFQVHFSDAKHQEPPFYGMNVFKVREVLEGRAYPVSPMPDANHLVEGMISLRGVYLPVIDLPKWMGYPMTAEQREKSIIIVADFSRNFIGLRVAHIHGVEEKDWQDIKPASNYNLNAQSAQIVNHTYLENSDKLCYILDIEKLLIEAMPTMAKKVFSSAQEVDPTLVKVSEVMRKKTLLYAEDSRSIQQYMNQVFERLGIPVKGFDNGRLLLNYLASLDNVDDISMVFTDLEMPVASGHTVIKEMRAHPEWQKLPIIVHTSMTSDNNEREVLAMGADGFIGKVDTHLIVDTIEKLQQTHPRFKKA
ncbi:response regulator receiver [Thiomicrospira aerophila AL3]|uniref:Response regulator receiver n=1 Tax=Thiomicrospira aerophila AL3 TaxID=717772 RepID=W0DUW6_9GAMM|nr:chemotaxis protein CheV [Thiomicrospira aerophila]AHF01083.1 response regulator receiver [Thiomicrospira aerophila AL3]